jgi:hypothetical protein
LRILRGIIPVKGLFVNSTRTNDMPDTIENAVKPDFLGIPNRLLTRADICALLKVTEQTTRNWERSGRLPAPIRFGRKPYWNPTVIAKLFEG